MLLCNQLSNQSVSLSIDLVIQPAFSIEISTSMYPIDFYRHVHKIYIHTISSSKYPQYEQSMDF